LRCLKQYGARSVWARARASWPKFHVIMFGRAKQIQTMCCVFLEDEEKVFEEWRGTWVIEFEKERKRDRNRDEIPASKWQMWSTIFQHQNNRTHCDAWCCNVVPTLDSILWWRSHLVASKETLHLVVFFWTASLDYA
jgi:hypothetical protein